MAPRRSKSHHSGAGGEPDYEYLDMKCASCNHPVSFITGGIHHGSIVGAVTLSATCLGLLLVLWRYSWRVKMVYPSEASKLPRKFGMNLSFILNIIYEILIVTQVTVGETSSNLKASFMILDATVTIFRLLIDLLLAYTVVGSLWARYKATRYPAKKDSASVYAGWLMLLGPFILLFEIPVYALTAKSKMFILKTYDISITAEFLDRIYSKMRVNNYINDSFQILARILHALLAVVTLVASKKLADDHREHEIQSKIPSIFLYVVAPALLLRDLSSIGVIASRMAAAISEETVALVGVCTHDVPNVVVLAGIVWACLQPDAFVDLRSSTTGIPLPIRPRKEPTVRSYTRYRRWR